MGMLSEADDRLRDWLALFNVLDGRETDAGSALPAVGAAPFAVAGRDDRAREQPELSVGHHPSARREALPASASRVGLRRRT